MAMLFVTNGMKKFRIICLVAMGLLATHVFADSSDDLWNTYRARYIENGRVVDGTNGNVSHSEGQGYGMLLAEGHADRETFDALWKWTQSHLQIRGRQLRGDHLFAWRWRPDGNGGGAVDDQNNASDGDLLIAWALARAGNRWNNEDYRSDARQIAKDVREKVIRNSAFGPLLLPGAKGFEKDSTIIVNLSYWVFPAFRDLNTLDPSPIWKQLETSGQRLIVAAQFGRWGLPPDWLSIHGEEVTVAPGFDPVFGYNAVRVPLYLMWANDNVASCLNSFMSFYNDFGALDNARATVNLANDVPGKDPALQGMRAIYNFIGLQENGGADTVAHPYATLAKDESYYSASLGLLANMANAERRFYAKP